MNILLGKHHDITSFASKDSARYAIAGVHYNHEKKRVEATDGAICIQVPVVEDNDNSFPPVSVNGAPASCLIPVKPLQKAIGNIPKMSLPVCNHLRLSVSNQQANLCTNDLDTEQNVSVKVIDAKFPDLDAVQPGEPAKLAICLSSALLKLIADYAERHGKTLPNGKRSDCPVRLEFISELSPVRFSFPLDTAIGENVRASGVAMPMRMS